MRSTKETIIIFATWNKVSLNEQFKEYCSLQAKKGKLVYFISDKKREPHPNEIPHKNINVLTWPNYRPNSLLDFIFVLKLFQKTRPHIVITNFSSIYFAIAAAFLMGISHRIIFTHSTIEAFGNLKNKHIITRCIISSLATKIVAVSNEIRNQQVNIIKVPSKKVHVLLNSVRVDKEYISPISKEKIIVAVAALEKWKGIDILINSLNLIAIQNTDYKVIIIGDGSERTNIENQIKEYGIDPAITIMGRIAFADVQAILRKAEIFILPSRADGTPQALLEAMANSCIVIGAKVGGIPEIIEHNTDGFLFKKEDAHELSLILKYIIEIPDSIKKELTTKAYNKVYNQFSTDKWSLNLEALLSE